MVLCANPCRVWRLGRRAAEREFSFKVGCYVAEAGEGVTGGGIGRRLLMTAQFAAIFTATPSENRQGIVNTDI